MGELLLAALLACCCWLCVALVRLALDIDRWCLIELVYMHNRSSMRVRDSAENGET